MRTCKTCKEIFFGVQCSQGHKIRMMSQKPLQNDDKLKAIKGKIKITDTDKQLFYEMLKGCQVQQGKSDSWLLAVYRSRFNEWPPWNWKSLKPIQPDVKVQGWVKHQQIKWWYQQKKAKGVQ